MDDIAEILENSSALSNEEIGSEIAGLIDYNSQWVINGEWMTLKAVFRMYMQPSAREVMT